MDHRHGHRGRPGLMRADTAAIEKIKSGDVEIAFRRFGAPGRTPILIAHGLSYFSYDWIGPASRLAADREVVADGHARLRRFQLEPHAGLQAGDVERRRGGRDGCARLAPGGAAGSLVRRTHRARHRGVEAGAGGRRGAGRFRPRHRAGRAPPYGRAHRPPARPVRLGRRGPRVSWPSRTCRRTRACAPATRRSCERTDGGWRLQARPRVPRQFPPRARDRSIGAGAGLSVADGVGPESSDPGDPGQRIRHVRARDAGEGAGPQTRA